MTRLFASSASAIASALLLLSSAPAFACEGACSCKHEEQRSDQRVAATCTCNGKGDCTCKKGTCQCKKCGKHGVKKTPFVEPLKGASLSPSLPDSARIDATAGIFI